MHRYSELAEEITGEISMKSDEDSQRKVPLTSVLLKLPLSGISHLKLSWKTTYFKHHLLPKAISASHRLSKLSGGSLSDNIPISPADDVFRRQRLSYFICAFSTPSQVSRVRQTLSIC